MKHALAAALLAFAGLASSAQGPRFSDVAAGGDHALALATDGTVWSAHIEGPPNSALDQGEWQPVRGLSDITRIAAGDRHALALRRDGSVWAWTGENTPARVRGLAAVRAIAVGAAHSLAAEASGHVWAWGENALGQLGNGSAQGSAQPVLVAELSEVVAVAAGDAHSLALGADASVWAWGGNAAGQLGDGSNWPASTPVRVSGLGKVKAIAAGGSRSLALLADGSLWTWGDGIAHPMPAEEIAGLAGVAVANGHLVAVGRNGRVWAATAGAPFARVPGLERAVRIAAGRGFGLAVTADGRAWIWGRPGRSGMGAQRPRAVGVPVAPARRAQDKRPAERPRAMTAPRAS